MEAQVEHRTDHLGVEMLMRFRFDGREIEIVEIVDQWGDPKLAMVSGKTAKNDRTAERQNEKLYTR